MALLETIITILISDLLIGLNCVIILYIILHFIKRNVLPEIPKWMKEYRDINLELHAIKRAKNL